jgi:ABC-type phosphate transport system substrate-binding protein
MKTRITTTPPAWVARAGGDTHVRSTRGLKVGFAGLVIAGAAIITGGFAYADYAPQAGDIVGVGGDTPQYAVNFLADGDYNGDLGFNASGAYNRLIAFSATPDANGRTAYANGSTLASPITLNPTVTLRAGTYPVQRVSSSGAAITAFLADSSKEINYIFSSTLPTAAQQNQANTNGWGFLHVVEIGTDTVKIAEASTSNAPAGLSAAELVKIYNGTYTTWNQIPGNSGGSSDAIIPLIPPSSSAIYKSFVADLKSANGGTAVTLAASVKTVEQNDPTAITSASSPADAIVPFSQARFNLWGDGYFHNPATAFPGGSALSAGIKLATGTPPDSGSTYSSPVTDYIIFRQSDTASTTPIEPGGTLNWIQTLFSNPGGATQPLVETAAGQALIAAAGVTPVYNDLGNVSSG